MKNPNSLKSERESWLVSDREGKKNLEIFQCKNFWKFFKEKIDLKL